MLRRMAVESRAKNYARARKREVRVEYLDTILTVTRVDCELLRKTDAEGGEVISPRSLSDARTLGAIVVDYFQAEFDEMKLVRRVVLEDLQTLLPGCRAHRILPRGVLLETADEPPLLREIFASQKILFSRS
jgi:hypothetical protein